MSDVLYPLGLIASCRVRRMDRVIRDEFESGSTTSRRLWSASNYKRSIELQHADVTLAEWRWLRSFFSQRGTYDSFWFRDNVNRGGNAKVRFAADVPEQRGPVVYAAQVALEEVAPIRQLPEFDEVSVCGGWSPTAGGGLQPVLWYDANREIVINNAGALVQDFSAYDAAFQNYHAPWFISAWGTIGGVFGQWQTYNFKGTEYAKTAINIAELTGAQPACTIFLIARQSATSTKQILFAIGAKTTGAALGIALAADGRYEPWLGGAETWTNARYNNSAVDTYRSLAVTWAASSNTATLYVNGASIGADSVARSLTAGPAVMGGAFDGSSLLNPSNAMTNCQLANVIVFAGALTLAQIKLLHNLLGYQYGLAVV